MRHSQTLSAIGLVTVFVTALTISGVGFSSAPLADHSGSSSEGLIDDILEEVVNQTLESIREEVRRNTGVDPLKRGYDYRRDYDPAPLGTSDKKARELRKLSAEHDRKITKLHEELQRKIHKAEAEFEREAAKEGKAEKIRKKRAKLVEKIYKARKKFRKKIDEENHRFDEKRDKILSKKHKD